MALKSYCNVHVRLTSCVTSGLFSQVSVSLAVLQGLEKTHLQGQYSLIHGTLALHG